MPKECKSDVIACFKSLSSTDNLELLDFTIEVILASKDSILYGFKR